MDDLVERLVARVAGKSLADRYLLKDKRNSDFPDRKALVLKEFKPHFDAGPTFYGIMDKGNMRWLEGHEYATRAAAEKALKKLRSGRAKLKYRGF